MTVIQLDHPVLQAKMSLLRQKDRSSKQFRELISSLSTFVGIEASKSLPLQDVPNLQSPLASYTGKALATRVGLSPIMRAGNGMVEPLLELFPESPVYHLGLYREKVSLSAVEYFSKLPATLTVDKLFVLDPLIATGNTAIAAINMILEWGLPASQISILAILGSAEGLAAVQRAHPDITIYVAAVDHELTPKGYISPGVGDTGDRIYGTH